MGQRFFVARPRNVGVAAPVYCDYYVSPGPYPACWRWRNGYRYRVC
jgi:hypothetical protein